MSITDNFGRLVKIDGGNYTVYAEGVEQFRVSLPDKDDTKALMTINSMEPTTAGQADVVNEIET
jgi:hypothetical protein